MYIWYSVLNVYWTALFVQVLFRLRADLNALTEPTMVGRPDASVAQTPLDLALAVGGKEGEEKDDHGRAWQSR